MFCCFDTHVLILTLVRYFWCYSWRRLQGLQPSSAAGNEDSARARPTRVQPESPAPMLLGTITSPANKNVKSLGWHWKVINYGACKSGGKANVRIIEGIFVGRNLDVVISLSLGKIWCTTIPQNHPGMWRFRHHVPPGNTSSLKKSYPEMRIRILWHKKKLSKKTSNFSSQLRPKVGVHRLSAWSQELAKPAAELSRGSTNVGVAFEGQQMGLETKRN